MAAQILCRHLIASYTMLPRVLAKPYVFNSNAKIEHGDKSSARYVIIAKAFYSGGYVTMKVP